MSNGNGYGAARLAAAAANIARGAAAGGLYGAAIGAAKSFLPEIAKAAAVLAAAALLLPGLVFAALPSIMFGYANAESDDIIALTDRASEMDAAFLLLESFDEEFIGAATAAAEAANTDESGALFDETETEADVGSTNAYWIIAINSVKHRQDLFGMDEDSIRKTAGERLSWSADISERTETGEGGETTAIRTLRVNVGDIGPDALMDKLGFSGEEKNWAKLLYGTLMGSQHVGFADSDGAGYYGTDYGDIVFSDASTRVVYYNQTDARWGGLPYGKTGTIAASGCGPTALAIAVASLADGAVTPKDAAGWSAENGYKCEGSGSYHSLIPAGAQHYGLKPESLGKDAKKLVRALADGKLVIAIMSKGHFTSGGHFIVLRGITSEGRVLVADPASVKRSGVEWELSLIVNEANAGAGAGGPFWALSMP